MRARPSPAQIRFPENNKHREYTPAFARHTPIRQERFPTQLVPLSARTAIAYLVLSHLMTVISPLTHEIV